MAQKESDLRKKLEEQAKKEMERLQRLRQSEARKRLAMKKIVGGR